MCQHILRMQLGGMRFSGSLCGLNRALQHPFEGGCDGKRQAKIRALHESVPPCRHNTQLVADALPADPLKIDPVPRQPHVIGGALWQRRYRHHL